MEQCFLEAVSWHRVWGFHTSSYSMIALHRCDSLQHVLLQPRNAVFAGISRRFFGGSPFHITAAGEPYRWQVFRFPGQKLSATDGIRASIKFIVYIQFVTCSGADVKLDLRYRQLQDRLSLSKIMGQ